MLSGLFFVLTIGAYVRYARRLFSLFWYLMAFLLFGLALMSKPMTVTIPFVLLLLDYWPLGRTRWAEPAVGESVKSGINSLLMEKIPFFALAVVSSVVTYSAQQAEAVQTLEKLPLGLRLATASISYVSYIGKAVSPTRLAVFYPYRTPALTEAVTAGAVLIAVSVAVIWAARRWPQFVVGWFWYLGILVPVIGLVQVGAQSMADRYTYIPLIGLLIMLAWSVPSRMIEQRRVLRAMSWAAATMVIAVCAALARDQVETWKDSETLFRHALSVTRDNWQAHGNLGTVLGQAGKHEEAIEHFGAALRINPEYADAHLNLGTTLLQAGQIEGAIEHYQQTLRLNPNLAKTHYNLGIALEQTGRLDDAIERYNQALRIDPDYAVVHDRLGTALMEAGRLEDAIRHYEQALRIDPDYADAHNNLGGALLRLGKVQEAIEHLQQALRLAPGLSEAHFNLGVASEQAGEIERAIRHYEQALRLKPDFIAAQIRLVRLRASQVQ